MRADFPEFVVRDCVYAPGVRLPRHAHDYSNVTIVVGGEIEEAAESGVHRGQPFSVVLKPAGIEHENRVGAGGARTLVIEMRRDLGGRWAWLEEPNVVRAAIALAQAGAAELESRAFALLAEVTVGRERGRMGNPPWLAGVMAMLDARFGEPLRFDSIARELGLHPVYLSRAFQRCTGRTMQEHVRALRLRHARRLLSASAQTITAIAADAGFADSSHLCRTFADLLDITPGAYRGLARTSGGAPEGRH